MTYLIHYGIAFNLIRNKQILTEKEAHTVIEEAAKKVGIQSKNLGCSIEGDRLIPSAEFIGQVHLKSEFTAAVGKQDVKIKRIPKKRG